MASLVGLGCVRSVERHFLECRAAAAVTLSSRRLTSESAWQASAALAAQRAARNRPCLTATELRDAFRAAFDKSLRLNLHYHCL
jgi:hypothetical protein